MSMRVVVVRPFGTHGRGDILADASEVKQILTSEHAADVVRVRVAAALTPSAAADGGTNGTNMKGS